MEVLHDVAPYWVQSLVIGGTCPDRKQNRPIGDTALIINKGVTLYVGMVRIIIFYLGLTVADPGKRAKLKSGRVFGGAATGMSGYGLLIGLVLVVYGAGVMTVCYVLDAFEGLMADQPFLWVIQYLLRPSILVLSFIALCVVLLYIVQEMIEPVHPIEAPGDVAPPRLHKE